MKVLLLEVSETNGWDVSRGDAHFICAQNGGRHVHCASDAPCCDCLFLADRCTPAARPTSSAASAATSAPSAAAASKGTWWNRDVRETRTAQGPVRPTAAASALTTAPATCRRSRC